MSSFSRLSARIAAALSAGLLLWMLGSANGQTLSKEAYLAQYSNMTNPEVLRRSSAGDTYAMAELGSRYAAGNPGVPQNVSEAARLYSLAYQRGYPGGDWLGRLPLHPIVTRKPVSSQPAAPTEPLPVLPLIVSVTSGVAPLETTISLDSSWPVNPVLTAWDLNPVDKESALHDDIVALTGLAGNSVTLQFGEPGVYPIRVTVMGEYGRRQTATTTITVEAPPHPPEPPQPLAPANDALLVSGAQTEFQWLAAEHATTYDFYFYDSVTPETREFLIGYEADSICTEGTCSITLPMDLPLGGRHIWRVRAVNSVATTAWVGHFFTVREAITEPPSVALLLGPDNGSVVENLEQQTFGWLPSERAQSYLFELINSNEEILVSETISQSSCSDTACTLSLQIDLPEFASYDWSVTATNIIGGITSDTRTLSVIPKAQAVPAQPSNLLPANGAEFTEGQTVTFSWTDVSEAATYEFLLYNQITKEENYTLGINPQEACVDDVCSLSATLELPAAPLHAWRVRARNSLGTTSWTRSTFAVVPPSNEPPDTPLAITPTANVFLETGNITFSWSTSQTAVNYNFLLTQNGDSVAQQTIAQSACGETTCALTLELNTGVSTSYQWQIQAENENGLSDTGAGSFYLIEPPSAPPVIPALLAPADGETYLRNSSVVITWSNVPNASRYQVSLADSVNNTSSDITSLSPLDVCLDAVCTYAVLLDVTPTNSQPLNVRASNSLGESGWQSVSIVVLDDGTPEPPLLISPADGSLFADVTNIDLIWAPVDNALHYDLTVAGSEISTLSSAQVCAIPDGGNEVLCTYNAQLPEPSPEPSSASETIEWQVRATTLAGTSDWAQAAFDVINDLNGTAPMAAFSISSFSTDALGAAPLTLQLDPSASIDDVGIVQYDWSFGDGSEPVQTSTDSVISHTYTTAGTFTLTLTVTDAGNESDTVSRTVTVFDPANTLTEAEASRLLAQASFGATTEDILQVRALGIDTWLEQQFSLQGPAHLDYVNIHSNGSNRWPRHEIWWSNVVDGDDQLRQRVAFALSQIFVISDIGYTLANSQYGVTHYYDTLLDHAFGNYRDLLEAVTKSPVMGIYLSMLQNAKGDEAASTRPDENYAREVLQLFSLGVTELNLDGSSTGEPAYTQHNIEEFARVFTGWNYKDAGTWNRGLSTGQDLISPMEPFENYHDTGSKVLLGGTLIPAGLTAQEDLDLALDNIANHPNVGPFMAKQLIQRLTTSNPTPGYVSRVASVFNDNGLGVRGDLRAVIKAILLDAEARTSNRPSYFGKLREPVIRLSHLWRAFSVSPGTQSSSRGEYNTNSPRLEDLDLATGQAILKSPSVFNFFKPEFAAIGPVSNNNLVAPEFEIMTESNEIATTNRIGEQINRFFTDGTSLGADEASYVNFDTERALAGDPDALLDHLDILLLAGSMTDELRTALLGHLNSLPDTDNGRSQRVRDAITLIVASPDYLIQM